MNDKESNKGYSVGVTEDGTPYIAMKGNDAPECVVCGKPKNIDKPWTIPVRAGSKDSFIRRTDGEIAKINARTVRGTGKGSAITYVFPLDTCDDNACINTAFYTFQDVCKEKLSECRWPYSLHRCAHCHETPEELKLCAGCKSVKYCSRTCQRADWPSHKLVCCPIASHK
jgi:hypothetical protein